MAMTKQQAKLVARDFANVKPPQNSQGSYAWQTMVFAVANHGLPSTMANEFEWACNHSGIWPNLGQLKS